MSDLVFQSNVDTSEKTSETNEGEPQNPKTVSETIVPTADNPSQVNLESDADKKDPNPKSVETEMEDIPTEVETENADKSPTIAEMVTEKSTHVVPEEVVMPDGETSLNEAETAEKEATKETAVEKDVETTVTTSESSDEGTGTAQEDTSDDEEDTQSEESNKSMSTNEKENEADKTVEAEKEKAKDVVDVDDYETTKTAKRSTGGITKSKKKETLKRKKESSSDSDYDATEDVANISSPNPKKATTKKVPQGIEEAPCDNISFHRAAFALR
ncbi:transcription elongation factor SPT5-like [Trifolium pratense]|uniref:transcription elongation factor SPT5-like n=1 Tax=Trifolium pratense TaxID=57577 RepID=UPI001E6921EC|nr:transcription elongation factor SPT5-like [Trifolium pratense]